MSSIACNEPDPLYRLNAAVAILDPRSQKALVFERANEPYWQFPQGGLDAEELPRAGAMRELFEETGISEELVDVICEIDGWLHYDWPKKKQQHLLARGYPRWRGQAQKWYVVAQKKNVCLEEHIDLSGQGHGQEFVRYAWVDLDSVQLLAQGFKAGVYAYVLTQVRQLLIHIEWQSKDERMVQAALAASVYLLNEDRLAVFLAALCGREVLARALSKAEKPGHATVRKAGPSTLG